MNVLDFTLLVLVGGVAAGFAKEFAPFCAGETSPFAGQSDCDFKRGGWARHLDEQQRAILCDNVADLAIAGPDYVQVQAGKFR